MARLSAAEIDEALRELHDWERAGDTIVRAVRFPDFMTGIRCIVQVAELAEAADHHPDIDIRYRNVRFALTTHTEGGLTDRDFQMARQIDEALGTVDDQGHEGEAGS